MVLLLQFKVIRGQGPKERNVHILGQGGKKMRTKIYLSPSNQSQNIYCVGNTNEKKAMEDLAQRIKNILDREYACETLLASPSLGIGMNERPREAKNQGCTVYLAIHSNAGGAGKASGAVAFYHPQNTLGKTLAKEIVKELGAICPIKSNRHISILSGMDAYQGRGYAEIRNPENLGLIAVLAETDFHDHPDAARWIISSKDAIAGAYVTALVNTFHIVRKQIPPAVPSNTSGKKYYRVQVGAFIRKENAEAMLKKLKKAGFGGYIRYE